MGFALSFLSRGFSLLLGGQVVRVGVTRPHPIGLSSAGLIPGSEITPGRAPGAKDQIRVRHVQGK